MPFTLYDDTPMRILRSYCIAEFLVALLPPVPYGAPPK